METSADRPARSLLVSIGLDFDLPDNPILQIFLTDILYDNLVPGKKFPNILAGKCHLSDFQKFLQSNIRDDLNINKMPTNLF